MELTQLIEIMRKSGVVGAGGAGFPSYGKLDKRADTIILNCAECEPLLKLHRQVLAKYAYEIVSTLELIADTLEAKQVIIAVKPSYEQAVNAVKAVLPSFKKTKIGLLPETYPAGDEVITIYETTGRVVAPGSLPITVGVIVYNVETILNVYNAIQTGAPVIYKYITVTGEVKNPVTLKVPLGMTVQEVVDLAGGATIADPVYINGGPMTGVINQPYDVITKTSNAILVMPKNQQIVLKRTCKTSISMKRAMGTCCQCEMCTNLCSRYLLGHPIEPHMFMRSATSGTTKNIKPFINTMFCSQCGICELYACPQGLSPRTLIGECKAGLRKNGISVPKDVPLAPVYSDRSYRQVSKERLTEHLGLARYDFAAPLVDEVAKAGLVKVKLSQHIGAPAEPVVKAGDKVTAGQVIGEIAEGKLGVNIHASISGTVIDVNDQFVTIKA